jgi:hypothetical protein
MRGFDSVVSRCRQRVSLAAQAACGQVCSRRRVSLAREHRRQQCSPRHPHDIRRDGRALAVGIFQECLHAIHQGRPLPDTGAALSREVAPLALGHRRHNAGAQQPMLQELGQPGGIVHVRFTSRDRFDVLRMDGQDLKPRFEPVEDRFPLVAGTLHGDMRAAARQQPIGES